MRSDKKRREASPTVPKISPRRARTGLALLAGAPSMRQAMLAGGYSKATAMNPRLNKVTIRRAIADAAAAYPDLVDDVAGHAERLLRRSLIVSGEALEKAAELGDPLTMTATARGAADVSGRCLEQIPGTGERPMLSEATLDHARAYVLSAALRGAQLALYGGERILGALESRLASLSPETRIPRGSIRRLCLLLEQDAVPDVTAPFQSWRTVSTEVVPDE